MTNLPQEISTLLDEYPDDVHGRSLLDEVIADVNLQRQLQRYQLIQQVMHHELPDQINTGFSREVMSRINQLESNGELDQGIASKLRIGSWAIWKPLAGLAVAASVAVVSVTLWQSLAIAPQSDAIPQQAVNLEQRKIEQLARQSIQGGAVQASSKLNHGTRWTVIGNSPALEQKLNAYLVNHTEYSGSRQSLIPQARVAGYSSQ